MEVAIRKAELDDLPAVHHITEKAYSSWKSILGYPPLPMMENHAARIERGEVLVACAQEQVLGVIAVEPGDDQDLIFSVAVDPDHSGKAIGTRLMAEAERRAKARGKSSMALYTNALMNKNISLYSRLGYVEKGRRSGSARPCSTLVDMVKAL